MRDWSGALGCRVVGAGRGRPVAGGSWPAGQPSPSSSQPVVRTASVDRSEVTMSKRTRALIIGATLAAMNLAGLTAVAHAQATNEAKDARRPPSGSCRRTGPTTTTPPGCRRPSSRPGCRPRTAPTPRHSRLPRCPPPRCSRPSRTGSQPGSWSRLGGWRRHWRSSLDWPCWPPGAPTAGLGSGTRPSDRHGPALDGAAAPTGSPITLPATDRWPTLPAAGGNSWGLVRAGCNNALLRPQRSGVTWENAGPHTA